MKKNIINLIVATILISIGGTFIFQFLKYSQFAAFLTGFPITVIGLILFVANINKIIKSKEMSHNDRNTTSVS